MKKHKRIFNLPNMIIDIVIILFLILPLLPKLTRSDSFIGENALSGLWKGVLIQVLCCLPINLLTLFIAACPIIAVVKLHGENVFSKKIDKAKAVIFVLASEFIIIALSTLVLRTMTDYSTSVSDMHIFAKTKLLFDISKDKRSGKTVVKEYSSVYAWARSEVHSSRGTHPSRSYYYILRCENSNEEDRFILSESDYSNIAEEIAMYKDPNILVEYYKNSHIIKDYKISGTKYDAYLTEEDITEFAEIRKDGNIYYRPENEELEKYGDINRLVWVVKRNGTIIQKASGGEPFTIVAYAYTSVDFGYDTREKGKYEIYLATTVPNEGKFKSGNSYYRTIQISNVIAFENK